MMERSTPAKLRKFEIDVHYQTLKLLRESGTDPVKAIIQNSSPSEKGTLAYAHRFWHGVFQDFPELRGPFPCSQRFGPYYGPEEPREEAP